MSNELIILDKYCEVSKTSLSFKREVTKDEWQKAFDACRHIEGCIQFWIGDLLKYREQKWGMYDDIVEETGLDKKTLWEYKNTSEKIESSARAEELSYAHHRVVVGLDKEDQEKILKLASKNKLTVRETKEVIKELKHENKKDVELPDNKYGVIYSDPPYHLLMK